MKKMVWVYKSVWGTW